MACLSSLWPTASSLARQVRERQVSPADVVRAVLARIAACDDRIGAFQLVRWDRAVAEADALATREDLCRLPLAGVPVAIKDSVPVACEPMRVGSQATSARPSPADHEVVRRLRSAGAIIIGTTRVPELCVWAATDSPFGITRNPWNLTWTPGGSSGGSAAAVASGMVPIALGADGMGSIRIPAAACGIVGLKPGTGLVPPPVGLTAWDGLAEHGPLANTVEDAALLLSVLAGQPALAQAQPPERPIRIAVSTRSPLVGVSADRARRAATLDAAQSLANAGHFVDHADPPAMSPRTVVAIIAHWCAGVAHDIETLDAAALEPRTRMHARLGRIARRVHLVRSQDRSGWRQLNERFFERFDLLLTPVVASRPLPCHRWSERGWIANMIANTRFAPFTAAWNFAGFPAASVPTGVDVDHMMPLSVQIIGAPGREGLILSVARQLEILRPAPTAHPPPHASAT